jgi:hypothetical protein
MPAETFNRDLGQSQITPRSSKLGLVRVVKYTPFAILVLVALVSGAFVGSRYEVKRDQPIEQQIEQQGAVPPTPTPML